LKVHQQVAAGKASAVELAQRTHHCSIPFVQDGAVVVADRWLIPRQQEADAGTT